MTADPAKNIDTAACPADDPRIARERLLMLQRAMGPVYLGSVFVSLALTGMLWSAVNSALIGAWLAYQLACTAGRALHTRTSLRRFAAGESEPGGRLTALLIAAGGLGWGATAPFVLTLDAPDMRVLMVVVAAGVTAGSASVYALLPNAGRAFLVLALLPVGVAYMSDGRHFDFVIGLMVCAYLFIMLRNLAKIDGDINEGLRIRFSMADLAGELMTARQKSDGLNRVLQEKVRQLETTQDELVSARDAAEEAARAKATFLATMSHEIRTPLNGVLGMGELLLGTPLSKRQTHLADTLHRSARQLLGVINDILDFSKIEAGKLEVARVAFDLRELIEDLAEVFAEPAHRGGIELACDVPADLHTVVRGDPDRLRQVLTNLVGNAVKFTEHGEVVIRVSAASVEADRAVYEFEVRDTGIGIRPEHQARIFDSFSQADGSTTRKFGGTGLGLAISRRLVELMGGEISLESEFGHGTCFRFTCPLEAAQVAELGARQRAPAARASVQGKRMLVAGKDDTSRELLVGQLRAWGGRVEAVADGHTALEYLRRAAPAGGFDVLVFTREVNDLGAQKLAQAVRGDPALATLRLVMLTTVANLESTGELLAGGISAYVTRPVRQRELFAAITGGGAAVAGAEQGSAAGRGHYQARVLVVEDNNVNQLLARNMLESLGCEVRVVENGQEAVEAITESPLDALREPYDLVLMDCQMPVLDGYGATRAVRAWENEQGETRMPIVALTANALEGDREACLQAGMDDYLAKPFTREELNQLLARWLPDSGPHSGAPAARSTLPPAARGRPQAVTEAAQPAAPMPAPTAYTATDQSPLDQAALARITALQRDGSPDLLAHLVGLFLGNTARLMSDVEAGLASGDAERVRRAVHTIKSSSANLGALGLSKLCAELERYAHDGQVDEVTKRLDVLHFELDGVIAALRALRPEAAA